MKIELKNIKVREVAENYLDNQEEGVIGFNGKLNIRPKYQREFVYDNKKRDAVIDTICRGFPLNVMYWVKNEDNTFEVLDGQQRTISFCQYIKGDFSLNYQYFHNLTKEEQSRILDYELMIYFCEGTDKEKLDWFKIINIAGMKLTDQELRNAIYTGEWLTNAKSIFSKTNCPAYNLAKDYVIGSSIRQEILEKAISWINNGEIEMYMAEHQHEQNANEIWTYFQNVINWLKLTFTNQDGARKKLMKGINWGRLYNTYKDTKYDTNNIEKEIARLIADEEVAKKSGIYEYILTRDEKYLNLRTFSDKQKQETYARQEGVCTICKKRFEIGEMEADHITPWSQGGETTIENCQMLCKEDNRRKSAN
ncbi:MAG: DUF262 domain-containing protein [Helicobacteraceae bacterium]|jgi:hypothetical protein|nr:DUF262 domain-containing protein [Helicobacteraceae bacterium]